jgi:hypothetical protein
MDNVALEAIRVIKKLSGKADGKEFSAKVKQLFGS